MCVLFYFREIWLRAGERPQKMESNGLSSGLCGNAQVPPQSGRVLCCLLQYCGSVITLWSCTDLWIEKSRSKASLEGCVIELCYKMEYETIWNFVVELLENSDKKSSFLMLGIITEERLDVQVNFFWDIM